MPLPNKLQIPLRLPVTNDNQLSAVHNLHFGNSCLVACSATVVKPDSDSPVLKVMKVAHAIFLTDSHKLADILDAALHRETGTILGVHYYYIKIHGYPPLKRKMQAYFRVMPPTVRQMVLSLERTRLIAR